MPRQYKQPPDESRKRKEQREAYWIRKALERMTLVEKVLATDEDLKEAARRVRREYDREYMNRYKRLKEESSHDR